MTLLGVLLASGVPWQQGLLPALVIELVCCLIELGMKHQSTHDHGIQTLQQRPDLVWQTGRGKVRSTGAPTHDISSPATLVGQQHVWATTKLPQFPYDADAIQSADAAVIVKLNRFPNTILSVRTEELRPRGSSTRPCSPARRSSGLPIHSAARSAVLATLRSWSFLVAICRIAFQHKHEGSNKRSGPAGTMLSAGAAASTTVSRRAGAAT
jgi:hypothetical protein